MRALIPAAALFFAGCVAAPPSPPPAEALHDHYGCVSGVDALDTLPTHAVEDASLLGETSGKENITRFITASGALSRGQRVDARMVRAALEMDKEHDGAPAASLLAIKNALVANDFRTAGYSISDTAVVEDIHRRGYVMIGILVPNDAPEGSVGQYFVAWRHVRGDVDMLMADGRACHVPLTALIDGTRRKPAALLLPRPPANTLREGHALPAITEEWSR